MSNEKAFTLIEVIVSLVLIGIMAAIAGMGLMKIAEGYVFAKQNAETAQKAQIAMTRIVKELSAASAITAVDATSVTYTRPGPVNNILTLSGGLVQISGTTLTNNVDTALSSFRYYNGSGTETTDLPTIRRIDIKLMLLGANNPFNDTVFVQGSY